MKPHMPPGEAGTQVAPEVLQSLDEALQAEYTASDASDELRIANAKELFEAIGSGDMFTRLSVLEAVALDPQGALGLGADGDTDLIAVLCAELESAYGSELRLFIIAALAAMPADLRVAQKLEQVWFLSDDSNERILAVSRLAQEEDPQVRSHLERTLLGDDPDRAQAVANVWRTLPEDSPKVQLRLALAAEEGRPALALGADSLELWLAELHDSFAVRAREVLQADPHTVETLSTCWEKLNQENRAWLLELATRLGSPELAGLTEKALQEEAMQLEAIQSIEADQTSTQYAQQLLELAEHSPNPNIQAAAIQAGAPGDNRFRAVRASVRSVRIAAIRRLGVNDANTLLELIRDPDWRIRSAAADRLVAFGETGKHMVEPLLQHQRLEVRMAAARVVHGQ